MEGQDNSIDDHQRFVLMKFKRNVSDLTKPHHDNKFFLRWLRARSWDLEAAEKMFRQSMKWREQWDVDGSLKTWEPPEHFTDYYPQGQTGFDKDGSPVLIVPFGNFDIVGMLHAFDKSDFIRMTIKTLEGYLNLAVEKGTCKLVVIFDLENFVLRQYAWRPAAEVVIHMIQMYEANYPEILKACYIINAPKVFAIAFNVIKRFLNEYTLGKMEIIKSDPKKWKKAILSNIDPENLPAHYGGTLTDPDGNPKYITVVKQGGKVPKHLYKNKLEAGPNTTGTKQYTTVVVKKGDRLHIDCVVADQGSFLRWDFRTEEHDIRFGITLKDSDGVTSPVVRHKRVAAHVKEETGVIECQAPATYTVTFDNSYSILRNKKLHYEIVITPPIDKLGIIPTEAELSDGLKTEEATTSD